jgi:hypothetical protein
VIIVLVDDRPSVIDPAADEVDPDLVAAHRTVGLSADEDADLRRLSVLRTMGELSPGVVARFDELKGRDRRAAVRPVLGGPAILLPLPRDGD